MAGRPKNEESSERITLTLPAPMARTIRVLARLGYRRVQEQIIMLLKQALDREEAGK